MRIIKNYRAKKRFANINDWYQTPLGLYLFDELQTALNPVLSTTFGYHSLQIGSTSMADQLLDACRVKHHYSLDSENIEADLQAYPSLLPIANDSVDLVVLMHHLSVTSEPHAILREVSRVLIPEGKLIIIDFNPLSLWGVRHFFQSWLEHVPWSGHYYTARRLKDWMQLLGFDQQKHLKVGYMPPIQHTAVTRRLLWLGKAMKSWFKFSAALNVLVFDKNISPMTPVRHRWVTRKLLPGKIARPTVGRGMKYDK